MDTQRTPLAYTMSAECPEEQTYSIAPSPTPSTAVLISAAPPPERGTIPDTCAEDPSSHHHVHYCSKETLLPTNVGKNKSTVLNHENLRIKSLYVRRYLKHNPFINCLLPLSCICVLIVIVYLLKDFPKHALHWIENQEANSWLLVFWFLVLFVVVSFPVTVGYLVLIITSGYLFGFIKGLLVVVMGANFGVAVAHYVIKGLQNKLPVHK